MRRIKFRGKNAVTKNWYYGDFVHKLGKTYIVDVSSEYPVSVSEKTVGQFTGLCDKDCKEIYEGDIIHLKTDTYDKDFGIVKWHKDGYFYIDDNFGKFPKDKGPIGNFFAFILRDFEGIEISISGNIHDNPEILKNNGL